MSVTRRRQRRLVAVRCWQRDESLMGLELGVFLFILFLGEMGAPPLPRERVRKQLNLSGLLIAWPVRRAQRRRKEQEVKEIEEGEQRQWERAPETRNGTNRNCDGAGAYASYNTVAYD